MQVLRPSADPRQSRSAIDGTVEETAVVAANPGIADSGSPTAVDHRTSSLAAPAHPSMIEHGTPIAIDAR